VTVLFADLKGSMDLAEQLDPEEWHKRNWGGEPSRLRPI
jgi:hypothetical protein